MKIRRQYTLPNCTLALEGLSEDLGGSTGQPVLSIVTNAECYFVGSGQKMQGGRVFLENLARSVNAYAQECLSGVRHLPEQQEAADCFQLEKIPGTARHRLTWQPSPEVQAAPVTLELTALQLFDLVEAVDQFVADTLTLPDFSLKLQPLPRRFRQPDEPFVQRVFPATLGIASLAAAALAFFLIPVPEIRKPEAQPQASPTETVPSPLPTPVP